MWRLLLTGFLSLLSFATAQAATTFNASVTNANGELTTILTWESTLSQCVGSGHPAWNGPKESSGTMQLPTITLSGTYTLTLTCSSPAQTSVRLTWVAPTENTDGTPLVRCATATDTGPCLAKYRIYMGPSADVLSNVREHNVPSATEATWTGLDPGTYFFAVTAVNGLGAESALSNIVSKTIAPGLEESEVVTLTVNPIPRNPSGLTVE